MLQSLEQLPNILQYLDFADSLNAEAVSKVFKKGAGMCVGEWEQVFTMERQGNCLNPNFLSGSLPYGVMDICPTEKIEALLSKVHDYRWMYLWSYQGHNLPNVFTFSSKFTASACARDIPWIVRAMKMSAGNHGVTEVALMESLTDLAEKAVFHGARKLCQELFDVGGQVQLAITGTYTHTHIHTHAGGLRVAVAVAVVGCGFRLRVAVRIG